MSAPLPAEAWAYARVSNTLTPPLPVEHPQTAALRAGMDEDRAEIVATLRRALDETLDALFSKMEAR